MAAADAVLLRIQHDRGQTRASLSTSLTLQALKAELAALLQSKGFDAAADTLTVYRGQTPADGTELVPSDGGGGDGAGAVTLGSLGLKRGEWIYVKDTAPASATAGADGDGAREAADGKGDEAGGSGGDADAGTATNAAPGAGRDGEGTGGGDSGGGGDGTGDAASALPPDPITSLLPIPPAPKRAGGRAASHAPTSVDEIEADLVRRKVARITVKGLNFDRRETLELHEDSTVDHLRLAISLCGALGTLADHPNGVPIEAQLLERGWRAHDARPPDSEKEATKRVGLLSDTANARKRLLDVGVERSDSVVVTDTRGDRRAAAHTTRSKPGLLP